MRASKLKTHSRLMKSAVIVQFGALILWMGLIFAVLHTSPTSMLFLTAPQSLIDHTQVQLQLFFTSEVGGAI